LYRRFFFVWFIFFVFCGLLGGSFVLFHRWQSTGLLDEAQLLALTVSCPAKFDEYRVTQPSCDQWDWKTLSQNLIDEYPKIRGLTLVDTIRDQSVFTTGNFPPTWNAIIYDPGGEENHRVTLSSGERLWTTLPSGDQGRQFRLWINLGPELSLKQFLYEQRIWLIFEAVVLLVIFLLFYHFIGNPIRPLLPLMAALQQSLEHADSTLVVATDSVPGEFHPLVRTTNLHLDARRKEFEDKVELLKQIEHYSVQKSRYSTMINRLKSLRDDDQTLVDKIQSALLEANREPVIILDRSQRILAMNEASRRVLGLGGQTGTTLRHHELENILKAEQQSHSRVGTYHIVTRDLLLGKMIQWKVKVLTQMDNRDVTQVLSNVIYLTQESSDSTSRTSLDELLNLYLDVLRETWRRSGTSSQAVDEAELVTMEGLLKQIFLYNPSVESYTRIQGIFNCSVGEDRAIPTTDLFLTGTSEFWQAFAGWLVPLLKKMSFDPLSIFAEEGQEEQIVITWKTKFHFHFNEWILTGNAAGNVFRRQLLHFSLGMVDSKLVWNPQSPAVVNLEIPVRRGDVVENRDEGVRH
jgi:PAS domain-containing protein